MVCSRCKKKEAAIDLPYANEIVCESCFTEFFERRVRKTIRRNELLDPKDKTAVALSGGKDSMTVLTILKSVAHKAPKSSLFAIMIDEGVPGYRDELVKRGAKYCKELGVDYHIFSFKEELGMTVIEMAKKVEKLGYNLLPCSYCGVFRRQLLNSKARELGATKIATGHNLDDECETALMNFLRGDITQIARGGARVGALRDKSFVPRIKPLRDTPEKEVALYAKIKKIPIVAGKCPYSRDSFRTAINKVTLQLEKKYPCMPFQILSSIDQLMPILREPIEKSGAKLGFCDDCGEVSSGSACMFCEMKKKLGIK
jgi:uncharacterized protein (TIGR00269 family)